MTLIKVTQLPLIEEHEATGEVADIYAEIRRDMQLPFVPNMFKGVAASPSALRMHWAFIKAFYENISLPMSLVAMIHFTIAESKNCQYCSTANELTCRTLGVDEETLSRLVKDLGTVSPKRVQAIIGFALKAAYSPQQLDASDYDALREQGVSDEELVEIILIAAIGNYGDTVADALKIDVDEAVAAALRG